MSKDLIRLTKNLATFGLTVVDVSDHPPYNERRGKTYAIFHEDKILCSYSSLTRLKTWVREKLTR